MVSIENSVEYQSLCHDNGSLHYIFISHTLFSVQEACYILNMNDRSKMLFYFDDDDVSQKSLNIFYSLLQRHFN